MSKYDVLMKCSGVKIVTWFFLLKIKSLGTVICQIDEIRSLISMLCVFDWDICSIMRSMQTWEFKAVNLCVITDFHLQSYILNFIDTTWIITIHIVHLNCQYLTLSHIMKITLSACLTITESKPGVKQILIGEIQEVEINKNMYLVWEAEGKSLQLTHLLFSLPAGILLQWHCSTYLQTKERGLKTSSICIEVVLCFLNNYWQCWRELKTHQQQRVDGDGLVILPMHTILFRWVVAFWVTGFNNCLISVVV